MRHIVFFLCVLTINCCSPKKNSAQTSTAFLPGKKLAELTNKKLHEVSGLTASIANPGLLWTHNDSGNNAEIYLIDKETNIKQTYKLEGVDNRDWEDIAIGPGPDSSKHYLYVAEIGDNLAIHPCKFVHRFEEPVFSTGKQKIHIKDFDKIAFKLGDVNKDTEALMVDPKTADLYIISKWNQPVDIYKIKYPYSTADTLTAIKVGSLPLTKITAADISSDGNEILIKSYSHIYYWKNNGNQTIPELLNQPPQELAYEEEPQGEAITWDVNDSGFYALSELNKGKKSYLYFYKRRTD